MSDSIELTREELSQMWLLHAQATQGRKAQETLDITVQIILNRCGAENPQEWAVDWKRGVVTHVGPQKPGHTHTHKGEVIVSGVDRTPDGKGA